MTDVHVDMKLLFTELRELRFPAEFQGTLDLLERDDRMPEVWQGLTTKGFTVGDIGPLIRAILQMKYLADDPPKIATKLCSLEMAVKSARMLAEFYRQDPTGNDERKRAEADYQALRSRFETYKAAVGDTWPKKTTHLGNDGVFSTMLSRVLVQNFGQQLDELVATVTTVLFDLPEPLAPNTVGARLRREEARRAAK